jgi:hypothetical protein
VPHATLNHQLPPPHAVGADVLAPLPISIAQESQMVELGARGPRRFRFPRELPVKLFDGACDRDVLRASTKLLQHRADTC